MMVRGGGVPTCFLGFQCRKGEWARRFGASQPMRMTASWFGFLDPPHTRLWRDRSRPQAGSPLIVIPIAPSVPLCSGLSRCGLARAEHAAGLVRRPTLTAPPHAGVSDARVGTKKRAFRSNKETDEGKGCAAPPKLLDKPHTRKPREMELSCSARAMGIWSPRMTRLSEAEMIQRIGRRQCG